jgi:hypothetical protein
MSPIYSNPVIDSHHDESLWLAQRVNINESKLTFILFTGSACGFTTLILLKF